MTPKKPSESEAVVSDKAEHPKQSDQDCRPSRVARSARTPKIPSENRTGIRVDKSLQDMLNGYKIALATQSHPGQVPLLIVAGLPPVAPDGGTPSPSLMRCDRPFMITNAMHQLDSPEERA